jgi:hypothetical protein
MTPKKAMTTEVRIMENKLRIKPEKNISQEYYSQLKKECKKRGLIK